MKRAAEKKEEEATFEVIFHEQCPFYSCYIFDGNAYVSLYPFARPDELESPVFVFFPGNAYDRLNQEVESVRKLALQTSVSPKVGKEGTGSAA